MDSHEIFNPRGQDLKRSWQASLLCGLILECIDPEKEVQDSVDKLPSQAKYRFESWREQAKTYLETNPEPTSPYP
ncbi:MAG: hypothetical protein BME94_08750 [Methanobacteriales archaeon Met13]